MEMPGRVADSLYFGEMLVAALPSMRHAYDPLNLSLDEAAKLRSIICLDQPCPSYLVSAADALDAGRQVDEAQVDARIDAVVPQDVGLILYTSGTTANPKGDRKSTRLNSSH